MQDLYTENYLTLLREIKEDLNKQKTTPCSWAGRINIIKYQFSPVDLQHQCNPDKKLSRLLGETLSS